MSERERERERKKKFQNQIILRILERYKERSDR